MPFIFKGLVDTLGETSQAAAAAAAATGEAVAGGAPASPEAAVAVPFAMVMGYGIARCTASGAQEVRRYERCRLWWGWAFVVAIRRFTLWCVRRRRRCCRLYKPKRL